MKLVHTLPFCQRPMFIFLSSEGVVSEIMKLDSWSIPCPSALCCPHVIAYAEMVVICNIYCYGSYMLVGSKYSS
uniref:Uncharacterized protein n=1 Tax=Aegilops tauschii subsp. strangulata TaxID=200361 RepID=A0A453ITC4_AEGTS